MLLPLSPTAFDFGQVKRTNRCLNISGVMRTSEIVLKADTIVITLATVALFTIIGFTVTSSLSYKDLEDRVASAVAEVAACDFFIEEKSCEKVTFRNGSVHTREIEEGFYVEYHPKGVVQVRTLENGACEYRVTKSGEIRVHFFQAAALELGENSACSGLLSP